MFYWQDWNRGTSDLFFKKYTYLRTASWIDHNYDYLFLDGVIIVQVKKTMAVFY